MQSTTILNLILTITWIYYNTSKSAFITASLHDNPLNNFIVIRAIYCWSSVLCSDDANSPNWVSTFAILFDRKKVSISFMIIFALPHMFSTRTAIIFGLDSNFPSFFVVFHSTCIPVDWSRYVCYTKSYHINHIHRFFIIINLCFIALISVVRDSHMWFVARRRVSSVLHKFSQ